MNVVNPKTKIRKAKRGEKFFAYLVKFFKEEDRFPTINELRVEFEYSYTMTYKTLLHLEEIGKIERRESELTNRAYWRFSRK